MTASVGWVQFVEGALDQEKDPGDPNPFYFKTPSPVLVDAPGAIYADEQSWRGSFGDRFKDELRCANARDGMDASAPGSYPLIYVGGKSAFLWAYRVWLDGPSSVPKARGAVWYDEHPPRWPPLSSDAGF